LSKQINNACQRKVNRTLRFDHFVHLNFYLSWTVLFFTGIAMSGLMLRLKAKELSTDPSFKASLGWYQNWKRRHSVSL